jgi:hypothetical protein
MPITLRHNEKLELSRVEYAGAIRGADMHNHAAFNAANPVWLGFDCISVIHADVDVSGISLVDLDGVFKSHRQLFEPLNLMFMRRSGWVCESPVGQRFLSHWLEKRTADKSPWADVRQFDSASTAAANGCCSALKTPPILKTGEGFNEIARFDERRVFALSRALAFHLILALQIVLQAHLIEILELRFHESRCALRCRREVPSA